MASATPFGGGNQPIFQKYLAGYGPDSPIMRASYRGAGGGGMGPVGAGGVGSGSLPGTYNPASGGIPIVPTSAESLQNLLDAIGGNIGGIGNIISGVTGAQQNALLQQYSPEYKNALATVAGNVANRATGNVDDLLAKYNQDAGEWGIGQGLNDSPANRSKRAHDVLGGMYAVQEQAARDLGLVKDATPTVNPYDPARLLPTYGDTSGENLLRNYLKSSPIPEDAYQRARADALAGIRRGFGAGGGGGFNWFNPMGRPNLGAVAPTAGGGAVSPWFEPGNRPAPVGPGWVGEDPSVIRGMPAAPPGPQFGPQFGGQGVPWQDGPSWEETTPNLWDQPFDMPQDWGNGDFFDEDLFF